MSEDSMTFELPIDWYSPESLTTRYVNNIVVQHTEHEFTLSFFETIPPIVTGTPEEQEAQLQSLKSVRAECVSRIIVSPERMKDFIKALQINLEKFRVKKDDLE